MKYYCDYDIHGQEWHKEVDLFWKNCVTLLALAYSWRDTMRRGYKRYHYVLIGLNEISS